MKKEYIAPQTDSIQMKPMGLIAASNLSNSGDDTQSVTLSEEEVSEFTSRRGDVWDDDYNY